MKQLLTVLMVAVALCCCTTEAERNRMRSGLDSINVRNRTDQPFTPQDVLPYVQFFDSHGDANDRLLAHYLLGRAYHEKGDAPMALECYQHAIDCADTTAMNDKDFAQLSRVYAQMAEIFYYQGLYREQLSHEKLSVHNAWKGKDTLAALMSYEQTSFAYGKLALKDSAICVIEEVARLYYKFGKPSDAAISLGTIAEALIEKGKYAQAKHYMDLYEMESGFFVSKGNITKGRERYYGVKGLYYLQIGLLDSAEYWYRKELQTGRDYNNQNCSACGLSSVFLRRHLPDSVAKYSLYAYAMNDSIYAHKTTKTIERMQAMYDYSRHQEIARRESERADEEKEKRQFVALLLVIAISFTALTVYKIYSERKTHKRQYFQHIQLLEQTQQEVLSLREHEDEYKELIAEKEHLLDQLQAKVKVYQKNNWHEHSTIEHKIKESNEYKNVVNRKRERELTAEELRGCRRLIIDNLPQFSNFLIARQHLLNKTDLNVCVLFRLGFKSKEISNMLGISQARVSQISTKIMKILFDESQAGASELASLLQEMY